MYTLKPTYITDNILIITSKKFDFCTISVAQMRVILPMADMCFRTKICNSIIQCCILFAFYFLFRFCDGPCIFLKTFLSNVSSFFRLLKSQGDDWCGSIRIVCAFVMLLGASAKQQVQSLISQFLIAYLEFIILFMMVK